MIHRYLHHVPRVVISPFVTHVTGINSPLVGRGVNFVIHAFVFLFGASASFPGCSCLWVNMLTWSWFNVSKPMSKPGHLNYIRSFVRACKFLKKHTGDIWSALCYSKDIEMETDELQFLWRKKIGIECLFWRRKCLRGTELLSGLPTSLQKNCIAMENFLPDCSPSPRWHHLHFLLHSTVTHPPHCLVGSNQTILSCLATLTVDGSLNSEISCLELNYSICAVWLAK